MRADALGTLPLWPGSRIAPCCTTAGDRWQFRAEQKKNPKLANIPVIVISAMAEAAQDIGAERVLGKPLSLEILLSAVRHYC